MTTLLNDDFGRLAVIEAQKYLLQRRISRHWKRSLVIAWNEWRSTGVRFQLETLVNDLNNAHDTEIRELAELLGIVGGFTSTIQDLSYWIDPVNGDDASGDGSQANPYRTLWFLDLLPAVIRHYVRIMVLPVPAGTVTLPEINTGRFVFEGSSGDLSIIGVGAPTVISGPWTVDTAGYTSANGPPGGVFIDVGAAIWVEGEHENRFLRFLTGNLAGTAWPVVCNSTKTVYIPYTNVPPAAADTFDFANPSVSVQPTAIQLLHKQNNSVPNGSAAACRVTFANLEIVCGNPLSTSHGGIFVGADSDFSFCKIHCDGTSMIVSDASINETYPIDTGLLALSGSGIVNIQWDGIQMGSQNKLGGAFVHGNDLFCEKNVKLQSFVAGKIFSNFTSPTLLWIYHCGFQQLFAESTTIKVETSIQNIRSGGHSNVLKNCQYTATALTMAITETVMDPSYSYWYLEEFADITLQASVDALSVGLQDYALYIGTDTIPGWCRVLLLIDPTVAVLDGSVQDIYAPDGPTGPISHAWPVAAWLQYIEGLVFVQRFDG